MQLTRESIFVGAVRSFCTSFAAVLGVLIAIVLVFVGLVMFSTPDIYPKKSEMTIAPDANGNRDLLSSAPVVLRIDIRGVIGQGDLTGPKFQNVLLDSQEGLLANKRVKAVLLYIDSPGGTVTDSDAIYSALMRYKKKYEVPIYAYVDGLCASGGMYIACSADKIFATTSSVIGSVGVVLGPAFNVAQLMDRYGVQARTFTQGKDKDMLNPFRPWQAGEDESILRMMSYLYDDFVSIVTQARPQMDRTRLINEYGAQVYVAYDAQQRGYIDQAQSDYSTAVTELVKAAKLEGNSYQVMQIAPPRSFFSDLAQEKTSLLSGKITHKFQIGPYMDSEFSGKFLYLYQPLCD